MSVQNTNDGGYIICGYKLIPMDDADGFLADISLIKTDGEGNVTVTSIIETTTSKRKILNTIDILGRETTKKGFQLHIYDDGSVEKKYLIK